MIYVSGLGKEISLQQHLRYSVNLGGYGIVAYQAESLKNARTGDLLLSKAYFSLPEMLVQNGRALLSSPTYLFDDRG